MKKQNEFVRFLLAQMQQAGDVSARAMFGGYGLYFHDLQHGKIMFALVANDILYFKTDSGNRPDFEQRDLPAFSYRNKDKTYNMSYHRAPEEVFDDPDEMQQWVNSALGAALRARKTGRRNQQ